MKKKIFILVTLRDKGEESGGPILSCNSVQMFEPFQDQNPHFFGNICVNWFFMKYFKKQIGLIVLGPNKSGKICLGKIWIFVEVIFFDPSEIGVLRLTWRVTLL